MGHPHKVAQAPPGVMAGAVGEEHLQQTTLPVRKWVILSLKLTLALSAPVGLSDSVPVGTSIVIGVPQGALNLEAPTVRSVTGGLWVDWKVLGGT